MNALKTKRIGISLILILTVISYYPVFQAGFIGFDDSSYVTQNDWVKAGFTWEGVRWAFTQFYSANWHPLTWLSHMLDCEIYGMNATGHHVSNLILHIANSIVLYLLFYQLTGAPYKSLALGLLFALHPLHVESVAWIAERKDVLSTFFGLLCLLAYYRYTQNFDKKYYCLTIVLLSLSLMSKSMLVTMPFLLIILDLWPLKREDRHRFKDKYLLCIPIIPSCVNTFFAQLEGQSIKSLTDISFADRIMNAFISIVTYMHKTFWPDKLSVLYPYPEQLNVWVAIFCLILLLFLLILGLYFFSKMPFFLTGYMWFIIALMPVIGIIQIGNQSMADRYTYVPHIGLFWAIIWTVSSFSKKTLYNQFLAAAFCLAVIGLGYKTYYQTQLWKNEKTLFQQAINNTKNNYIAHNNLGTYLTDPKEALKQYERCIKINPEFIIGHVNKGNSLLSIGKIKEAEQLYKSLLEDEPYHTYVNWALAELYYQQHQLKEALQCYYDALKKADDCGPIYKRIAQIFRESGKLIESQFFYKKALDLNPLSPAIHYEYGCLLISLKQDMKAMSHLKRAIELRPDDAMAHNRLSEVYEKNNQIDKAWFHIRIARHLAPENVEISEAFQNIHKIFFGGNQIHP